MSEVDHSLPTASIPVAPTSPTTTGQPIAWMVEFENGAIELWLASDINGVPAFGETVTPLYDHPPTTPRVAP